MPGLLGGSQVIRNTNQNETETAMRRSVTFEGDMESNGSNSRKVTSIWREIQMTVLLGQTLQELINSNCNQPTETASLKGSPRTRLGWPVRQNYGCLFTANVCFLGPKENVFPVTRQHSIAQGAGPKVFPRSSLSLSVKCMSHLPLEKMPFLPLCLPHKLTLLGHSVCKWIVSRSPNAAEALRRGESDIPCRQAASHTYTTQTHPASYAGATALSAQRRATSCKGEVYAAIKPSEPAI